MLQSISCKWFILFIAVTGFISGKKFQPALTGSANMHSSQSTVPLKYIYLTFDDGPLNRSENIDSVILAERLKISVFIVGEHAEMSRRLGTYYKLYEQNPFVEAYNHSFSQARNQYALFYRNPENVLADIQRNEREINLRYKIVRLPGRNTWRIGSRKKDDGRSDAAAADLVAQNGYKIFGWDLGWQHHTDGIPVQSLVQIENEIESRLNNENLFTPNHLVLLLHDEMFQKKWEESELKKLIEHLRLHENFVFEHLRFYPDR